MQNTYLKQTSFAISAYFLLLLLPLVVCSSHEDISQPNSTHKNNKENSSKWGSQMTFNVIVHGLLLWFSMGLLMPVGILIIRKSVREEQGTRRAKVLFYFHVILQTLSLLLATTGAVMSVRNFENSFNNNHQRLGLALYGALWVQALIGFFRPHSGRKERRVWYLVHWILGTVISLVGIINIYTGLNAYHKKTKRSSWIWTILFTAELSFVAVYYLFQDKRDYIEKQRVILGNEIDEAIRQLDQEVGSQNQNGLLPQQPCGKRNALKNLFE